MIPNRRAATLSVLLGLAAACTPPGPAVDLAIADVTVVDVESGTLRPHQTVLIVGDRIADIVAAGETQVPSAARVVDAAGKFLIPGLWNMHVHAARARRAEYFWPLFLAYGITGVREMGSYVDQLEHWRQVSVPPGSGAPRIRWGVMYDGDPPVYDFAQRVPDDSAAKAAVRDFEALGFDFMKVYDRLSRQAYFALAEAANEAGVTFAGHVPARVSVIEASDAGQRTLEHVRDLFLAAVPSAAAAWKEVVDADAEQGPGSARGREALQRLASAMAFEAPDAHRLRPVLERLVANGTFVTPTLAQLLGRVAPAEVTTESRLRYVPPAIAETWRQEMPSSEQQAEIGRRIMASAEEVVGMAHRAGVGILAGTDVSGEPFIFAGSGLHDELELLVQAGLSPLDALRSATLSPAEVFGASELGTVRKGKLADLVVLDADPLEDIRNTRRIAAVVAQGRLIDATQRNRLLEEAAAAASRIPAGASELKGPSRPYY